MPLWTILTKCPAPVGAGVEVALLGSRVAALAARRARDLAAARGERFEDRVEVVDHFAVPADHHAIAALDPPDAARSPDIDVVQSLRLQRLCPAHVVLVVGVAAVDHDVAGRHQLGERHDRPLGHRAGRQHDPYRSRLLELRDQVLEAAAGAGAFTRKLAHRVRVDVVDHAVMAAAHQPPGDVRAHPAEADDSELHPLFLPFRPVPGGWRPRARPDRSRRRHRDGRAARGGRARPGPRSRRAPAPP